MSTEDTRMRILEASIALVEEKGVRAVSFREVARRAGVSHQAPYHHFGNHVGILRAIAEQGFATLAQEMSRAGEGLEPREALLEGGLAYVRFAREHQGHFRVMFDRTLVALHDSENPVRSAELTHDTLVAAAARAHAAGHGAHLPVDVLATLCWSTAHGLAVLLAEGVLESKPNTPSPERVSQAVITALAELL